MSSLRTNDSSRISFYVKLRCRDNPTGGTVEFGVSADDVTPPSNWAAGTWGTYGATTGLTSANTPTIGGSGAAVDLTSFETGDLVLWYRITVGAEIDALPYEEEPIEWTKSS